MLSPTLYLNLKQLFLFSTYDTRIIAKFWIEKNLPHNSKIVSFPYIPPIKPSQEMIKQILKYKIKNENLGKGFKEIYTGKGLRFKYLLKKKFYPAYHFILIPTPQKTINETLAQFDLSRYKNFDYIIFVLDIYELRNKKFEGPKWTIPRELIKYEKLLCKNYYKFVEDVRNSCILIKKFGPKTYYKDVKKTIFRFFFKLWGRAGPLIEIYKIKK